jgi:PKD domain
MSSMRLLRFLQEEQMLRTCRRALPAALALFAAGCILDNPDTPELEGPSTIGRAIEVRALPDQLIADGWSSSVIEAVLRGPNSERIPNVTVFFEIQGFVDLGNLAPLNGPRPTYGGVEATQVTATTDGDGVARARYWAPFRDEAADDIVTIMAREAGVNFRQVLQAMGQTDIFLRAADRPVPSPFPTPRPGCEDPTAEVALSGVCEGGEIPIGRLIFANGGTSTGGTGEFVTDFFWDFGDGSALVQTGRTPTASHVYSSAFEGFEVSITLTVANSCGATASSSVQGTVVDECPEPAAPPP